MLRERRRIGKRFARLSYGGDESPPFQRIFGPAGSPDHLFCRSRLQPRHKTGRGAPSTALLHPQHVPSFAAALLRRASREAILTRTSRCCRLRGKNPPKSAFRAHISSRRGQHCCRQGSRFLRRFSLHPTPAEWSFRRRATGKRRREICRPRRAALHEEKISHQTANPPACPSLRSG